MSGGLPLIPLYAIWRGQEKHCLYLLLLCYSIIALQDDFSCTFFPLFSRQRTVNKSHKDYRKPKTLMIS